MTEPHPAKQEVRRQAMARRQAAAAAAAPDCGDALAARGLAVLVDVPPATVSGFWPIRDEIDVRPLLTVLRGAGWTTVLPVVMGPDVPLEFRVWRPDTPLVQAGFGVLVPAEGATVRTPDVALVPLLAFDRRGNRIGYGKGHYDRTLRRLRRRGPVLAVGVAFAAQEVPLVPAERHDEALDAVLTEREWIWIGRDA